MGRRLSNDADFDVELIYGARRLFIARHLNMPLLVEERELTDAQAIVAMHSENRNRRDVSPYERGLSYMRWLRSGHFSSQEHISKALGVSPSQVSRMLRIAKLPSVIVGAFPSPLDICESWGLELIAAWDDPERRPHLSNRARALAGSGEQLPGRTVFRELMAASLPGRKLPRSQRDEVVKSAAGETLFRIKRNARAVALVVPLGSASPANLAFIRSSVAAILEGSSRPEANG
jgi:ParB family chromosome partitioning protein